MHKKLALSVLAFVGCSTETIVDPSPNPPPSWGVPVTGGTMLVSRDGKRAVVADPDRDRIQVIDLDAGSVIAEQQLAGTDEPGRIIEDGAGRFHVALRRGGALLTLTPIGDIAFRRAICAEPRGVAWASATDQVHVACATGELVSLPAAGGDATRTLRIDRDLRDVLVDGTGLVVTRFRTAEMIRLDANGAIASRALPPTVKRLVLPSGFGEPTPDPIPLTDTVAAVAWRAIQLADGRIVVMHQRQVPKQLGEHQQGGYGNPGCGGGDDGPMEAATTVLPPLTGAPTSAFPLVHGALPVDLAQAPNGNIAVVVAGMQMVHITNPGALAHEDDHDCDDQNQDVAPVINDQLGTPTSIAYRPDGTLLIFYPEVPTIVAHGATGVTVSIPLGGSLGYDAGRALFHRQTQVGLACASCHPEARDDGLVWNFQQQGLRRTQNLAGHILERAPYHWVGDMTDLPKLMNDVFAIRMAGGTPTRSAQLSLGPWLDRVPPPAAAPVTDAAAVARGKVIFESSAAGCVTCHNGALLTNKALVNVGTNGAFKVPSLVGVGARAPFMHDGSAKTLLDRFGPTGGGDLHGHTSQLSAAELGDLVAFLDSL